ncbi:lytic polysaccharide monooxygenase [Pseudomonas marginalis]|uniref:lytic polysaccharide monooxygenase n=1 Tax=Pseudomonas marginalis TaxID=298 RepID=UPI001647995C|nr:lytic polysaccharide monooxygenase [Pseudomonas marginalis]
MLDYPNTRQGICISAGNYSWPPDGSGITPGACKTAAMIWSNPADRLYPLSHWHEFANNVAGHRDLEKLKAHIADGTLCSAGDPKKRGFDLALPDWQKTPVHVVNGKMTVRIVGSQPHVPSYVRVFLTRPGYRAIAPLRWDDLQLIHTEELSSYRTDWTASVAPKPAFVPTPIGFFQFDVPVPNGQTGEAILYTYWQREDTGNEGFGNCADITFGGTVIPAPWTPKGPFIASDIAPKPDETVRVRVFGSTRGFVEIVDESVKITAANEAPAQWGLELKNLLAKHGQIVQVGVLTGNSVVFDPNNMAVNQFYVADKDHAVQMSVIGGGTDPGDPPPVIQITGPTLLKSKQAFTFIGSVSSGSSRQFIYHWAVPGMKEPYNELTVRGNALDAIGEPTRSIARLNVIDPVNNKSYQKEFEFTVEPDDGGGEYPAYKEGTAYKAGDIVSNNGKNYKCKPHPYTAWCAGAAWAYAPGTGTAWDQAWDEVR